jgi:hypothetical protein
MPIKVMTFEQWLLAFPEVREEVKENPGTCERCDGSGEITCPDCDGSGECTDEAVALKQLYAKQLQSDIRKAEESGLFEK